MVAVPLLLSLDELIWRVELVSSVVIEKCNPERASLSLFSVAAFVAGRRVRRRSRR